MRITVDLNLNINDTSCGDEAPPWARELKHMLGLVIYKENQIMSAQSDALDQAEAAALVNNAADDAAEALLVSLSQMVKDLSDKQTDPATTARIEALSAVISERAAKLSAAVVANTPSAPAPAPEPEPAPAPEPEA